MTRAKTSKQVQISPKTNAKTSSKKLLKQGRLSSFVAGFGGAAFGIALMLAVALPMIHQQLQFAVASLNHKVVAMAPSDNLQCLAPSSSSQSSAGNNTAVQPTTQTASTTGSSPSIPAGGMGGGAPGSTSPGSTINNVVTRLIGVSRTTNNATISDTGANSTNDISQTTTNTTSVKNSNDISVVNSNPQAASSGSVNSSQNTTSGNTASGSASNSSNVAFIFKVNN